MKINIGQVKEPCPKPVIERVRALHSGEVFSCYCSSGKREFFMRLYSYSGYIAVWLSNGTPYKEDVFNSGFSNFIHHPHATLDGLCIKEV